MRETFGESVEFQLRVQELYGNDQSDTARTDAFTTYVYNAALQRNPTPTERDTARNDLDLANAKGVNETVAAARTLTISLLTTIQSVSIRCIRRAFAKSVRAVHCYQK